MRNKTSLLPAVVFQAAPAPSLAGSPRPGWAACLFAGKPSGFYCPRSEPVPLLPSRRTRPRSALGSGAPPQPGTIGREGGFRASIPGWLNRCLLLFGLAMLIQLQAHCVSLRESSSVNRKQNVTLAGWRLCHAGSITVLVITQQCFGGLRLGALVLWLVGRKEGTKEIEFLSIGLPRLQGLTK